MYIVTLLNGELETVIHGGNQRLVDGKIVKGINTIDTFTFSMLPTNAGFYLVNEFTTRVSVYNTEKARYDFIGRVLYPETSMGEDGLITKQVTCESIAGYLCDSQQTYMNTQNWTVSGILHHLIDCHNSQVEEYKRFTVGQITATDKNDNLYQGIQRENTREAIESKLIEKIGGELQFRVVDGVNYIDYLEAIGEEKTTEIALSVNMKSITREQNPTAYITRLIPLGCKLKETVETKDEEGNVTTETVETEERLDITAVNGGLNYIDDEVAIAVYGIHVGFLILDDVKTAATLMTKGEAWLKENNKVQIKYSITALDLSIIGLAIDDFDVGNYHPIKNALLGIDDTARIIKKTVNICEPQESSIEVGDNFKTLSDIQREQAAAIKKAQNKLDESVTDLTNKFNKVVSELDERVQKIEGIDGLYFYIKYSQYVDGHVMTDVPNDSTEYMGTCSTNQETAPTDYKEYTWCKIRGEDGKDGTDGTPGTNGKDGKTQYLHIKYSNDGKTFTGNLLPTDISGWKSGWYQSAEIADANRIYYPKMIPVKPGTTYAYTLENANFRIGISRYTAEDDATFTKSFTYTVPTSVNTAEDTNFVRIFIAPVDTSAEVTLETYQALFASGELQPSMTENGVAPGEMLGSWIGTLVDFNEADSEVFSDYTWKKFTEDVDEELGKIREEFHTEIQQLADSIKLEVAGSLGSNASIILSAGPNKFTGDMDLSQVRNAFADDPTAISISAGIITFNSNTIVINSTNFSVTSEGVITAKSGTVGGITLTATGIYSHNANTDGTHTGWYKPETITETTKAFFAGATDFSGSGSKFSVTYGGDICAISGTIGAINLSATGIYSCNSSFNGSHAGWYRPESITTDATCFFAGATSAEGKNASFYVTYGGKLYAEGAVIDGEVSATYSATGGIVQKTTLNSLGLNFKLTLGTTYDIGRITSKYMSGSGSSGSSGIAIQLHDGGSYIMLGKVEDSTVVVDYVLNYGWSSNYTEKHIFQTSARFLDAVYIQAAYLKTTYLYNNNFITNCKSDGTAGNQIFGCDGSTVYVGTSGYKTILRGSTVYLKDTSTVVTSDRNAKNSVEALPDQYEAFVDGLQPVRFKYNEGRSGRYHVGYIAQDVEQALTDAGLKTTDFAGFVNVESMNELGLAYDEFIALLHLKIKRLEARLAVLEH